MQIMVQASAPPGTADELKAWCLETLGPRMLSQGAAIERLIVNLARPAHAEGPYGAGESLQGDAFDVVLQAWVPDIADFHCAMKPLAGAFAERVARWHGYRLTEYEVINRFGRLVDGPTPGLKLMRGLHLFDDLPDAAAQRIWAHHSELAVKVHVGLARYARHWVDEVLTPGSPRIRGLSDLHFPCEQAMRDRYFDSPRGREEIMHDIGHFICGGTQRFYGEEHILR